MVFSSNTRLVLAVDLLCLISVVLSFIATCYMVAFYSSLTWLTVVFYICDMLYLTTAIFQFFVSLQKMRKTAKSQRNILGMTAKVVVDVMSLLPLELAALALPNPLTISSYFRVNRLLRLYHVYVFFSKFVNSSQLHLEYIRIRTVYDHLIYGYI